VTSRSGEPVPSTLTWLAHSESERRQTQEVIRLLEEPGTVDEMGLGRIRDALADLMFPGTSTLHTRARYFLLIPWAYRELERQSPLSDPTQRARYLEVRTIEALRAQRELSEGSLVDSVPVDDEGIIGDQAGAALVQLPSQAYWNGLLLWGIRLKPGSRSLCHRMLSRFDLRRALVDEDGEPLPGGLGSWWDPHMPDPPPGWRRCASLALSRVEAEYLHERVTTRLASSTLAELLEVGLPDGIDSIWELDLHTRERLSGTSRELIDHADRFSLLMHGAALLYNILLAEEAGREERLEQHRAAFEEWTAQLTARIGELGIWHGDIERFWTVVARGNQRVPSALERGFVESWIELARAAPQPTLADSDRARALIADRERRLKRAHARLGNPSALENWGGSSGASRLNFRWPYAAGVLRDIRVGLGRAPVEAEQDA
jgi:hypothetical protein